MLTLPWGIDYASAVVGVLVGALFGCRRKFDVVGTTVLGFLTGFGGGVIRDLLMGATDVYFLQHPDLVWVSLAICLVTFYFRGLFLVRRRSIFLADALSVALFSLAGANKAFAAGLDPLYVVMMGVITAVGGGAMRDSMAGVPPAIFRQSNYYAVACLGGSIAFAVLAFAGAPLVLAGDVCVAVVLVLRYASTHFGWRTREEADFVPRVEQAARSVRQRMRRRSRGAASGTTGAGRLRRRRGRRVAASERVGEPGRAAESEHAAEPERFPEADRPSS